MRPMMQNLAPTLRFQFRGFISRYSSFSLAGFVIIRLWEDAAVTAIVSEQRAHEQHHLTVERLKQYQI